MAEITTSVPVGACLDVKIPPLPCKAAAEVPSVPDDDEDEFVDAEEGQAVQSPADDLAEDVQSPRSPSGDEEEEDADDIMTTEGLKWPSDKEEAAELIRKMEETLDQDLVDIEEAVNLFLDSRFNESEEFVKVKYGSNLYYTLGYAFTNFLRASMTWDAGDVSNAISAIRTVIALSNRIRKRSPVISSVGTFVNFVRPGAGVSFSGMTRLQKHAELIHAEGNLLKGVLTVITDSNVTAFVREGINIRNSYGVYRSAWNHVLESPEGTLDDSFLTGVLIGIGTFNIVFSLLPAKVLKIFEVIGFTGDQEMGLKCLEVGSGWELPKRQYYGSYGLRKGSKAARKLSWTFKADENDGEDAQPDSPPAGRRGSPGVVSAKESKTSRFRSFVSKVRKGSTPSSATKTGAADFDEDFPISTPKSGIRSYLCTLSLAGFHAVLPTVSLMANGDPELADHVLDRSLVKHPRSTYHLLLKARHSLFSSGNPSVAVTRYTDLVKMQSQWRTLHHISFFDLALLYAVTHEWAKSAETYTVLLKESKWSPALYSYAKGCCLAMQGKWDEAGPYFAGVQKRMQRIAGKRIPIEKFIARKSRKLKAQNGRLVLPAYELYYMFGFFRVGSSADLLQALGNINAELAKVREDAPKGLWAQVERLGVGARVLVDDDEDEEDVEFMVGKEKVRVMVRENWWDDVALLLFLRAVALRELSLSSRAVSKPVSPSTIFTSPVLSTDLPPPTPSRDSPSNLVLPTSSTVPDALADLATVVAIGHLIQLDHYIVPFARYELGILYSSLGYYSRARTQWGLCKTGGYGEREAKRRGWKVGKYGEGGSVKHSNDNWLSVRTHNALVKLDVMERVKAGVLAGDL